MRSFFDRALLSSTGTDRAEDPRRTANRGTHRGEDTAKEGSIQDQDKSPTSTNPYSHRIKQATDQTTTKKPESHRGDSRSSSISTSKQITRRRNTVRLERSGGKPVGGRLAYFYQNWEKLTTDHWVLEAVSGYHLELLCTPHQRKWPKERGMDEERCQALSREIEALIEKKAVTQVHQVRGSFISPMFPVPKGDGAWRPVIDLR